MRLPIYINTLNIFRPIKEWCKARKFFIGPKVFRENTSYNIIDGKKRILYINIENCKYERKPSHMFCTDVPKITLSLFGKWQWTWKFVCLHEEYTGLYYNAILTYNHHPIHNGLLYLSCDRVSMDVEQLKNVIKDKLLTNHGFMTYIKESGRYTIKPQIVNSAY